MTKWLPDLTGGAGPLYQRLADRIEADIDQGVLASGSKLPPQRDLAFDIRTTVGTVGRAYSLLRERGLVSGEVGRGTYVLTRQQRQLSNQVETGGTRLVEPPNGKLRFDATAAPDIGQGRVIAALLARIGDDAPTEIASYSRSFPENWYEAGSRWLSRSGYAPPTGTILPTLGVQAATMAVISAMTNAGDYIAFEHLTYAQVARGTALLGRRVTLVRSDADGIDPDDFEAVCAQKHPKLMFLMPSAQNPTCSTMTVERREAIVRIARTYNVLLLEDDLYGHMADDGLPLIAQLAPERTFLAGGLSKAVAAGLRGGWIACPEQYCQRLRVAHKMLTGGMPFILAEGAARLVLSGQAEDIQRSCLNEINARLSLTRAVLGQHRFEAQPNIPFVWLALPDPWNSGTFKQAAYENGVLVDDEDEFKAGRSEQVFHRIRFGVTASQQAEFRAGLNILRRLLDEGPVGYASYD